MQTRAEEQNYIDRDTAARAAAELNLLFSPDAPVPALTPGEKTSSLPLLVESLDRAPLKPIDNIATTAEIFAIDGGSSVLAKGGNVEVIAWRAGFVHFAGSLRIAESCAPPHIIAYNRLTAADILREYLADSGFVYHPEDRPLRLVDELRWLAEWRILEELIESGLPNTLILIDGSLRIPPAFDSVRQHALFKKASVAGIHIAAVTKTSSLSLDGLMPIDVLASNRDADHCATWRRKLNRAIGPDDPWLGDIYLAKLHAGAGKPYRIDINRYSADDTDLIFTMLASVSDDTEFAGYPYPLAAAHRLARLDSLFKKDILTSIGAALEERHFPRTLWAYLTGDMHDKLNADVTEMPLDDR